MDSHLVLIPYRLQEREGVEPRAGKATWPKVPVLMQTPVLCRTKKNPYRSGEGRREQACVNVSESCCQAKVSQE